MSYYHAINFKINMSLHRITKVEKQKQFQNRTHRPSFSKKSFQNFCIRKPSSGPEVGERNAENFAKIRDSHFILKHWFG